MENQALTIDLISGMLNSNFDYLSKVCHPLFKNTPVKYFDYIRYYDNGECIAFSVLPDLATVNLHFSLVPTLEEFKIYSLFNQKACFLSISTALPPGIGEISPEKYQENLAKSVDCGIYHRLYLVKRVEDYYVTCGFGVDKEDNTIINFYLNSLMYLERFLNYFELISEEYIISNCKDRKFIIPGYNEKLLTKEFSLPLYNAIHGDFLSGIPFLNVTNKEKECMALIAQGYTMKAAARIMQISPRTVEQHLRNTKDKLGVNTKNQLVEIWHTFMKDN